MTVGELLEHLKEQDPAKIVVLSKDEEGNAYKVLRSVATGFKFKDGEIGLSELTEADRKAGYGQADIMKGGKNAVVLWP